MAATTNDPLAALATHALGFVRDGDVVGLGSGRAAGAFVHALAARVRAGLKVHGVPTSEETARLARELGIDLVGLEADIAATVAGADEVDGKPNLTKGDGGRHGEAYERTGGRMQIGMVGRGRMGGNLARRLMKGGHEIVGYAADPAGVKTVASEGGIGTTTLDDFIHALRPPRVAWVMVPAGAATEQVVTDLAKRMSPGDTIVDGGNSFYKDDVRRMKMLRPQQIHYVDVGTSGGVWGIERGYCLMIGGEREAVEHLAPIFKTLAPGAGSIPRTPGREAISGSAEQGYLYCGPSGAGAFG